MQLFSRCIYRIWSQPLASECQQASSHAMGSQYTGTSRLPSTHEDLEGVFQ